MQTVRALLLLFVSTQTHAIEVIVPERGNLQYLTFWVAMGAGYIDAQPRYPDSPGETGKLFGKDAAQVAVLPPPLFFQVVSDGVPLVAVANLLRNDPIDLVVRVSSLYARRARPPAGAGQNVAPKGPLKQRLEQLKGLRIGIAPGPMSRFQELWKSVHMAPTVEVVTLMGQEQNQALADGKVDGLYAHTPYLERALLQQHCVVVVNQAGGEVPELSARQIHTLAVTQKMLREQRPLVDKLVAGIARAEKLIHENRAAALEALLKAAPPADKDGRALTQKALELYADAIPETPRVTVEGLKRALELYPAKKRPPDLSHVDWNSLVIR